MLAVCPAALCSLSTFIMFQDSPLDLIQVRLIEMLAVLISAHKLNPCSSFNLWKLTKEMIRSDL